MASISDYESKTVSLLKFALKKKGVDKTTFFIGEEGQEKSLHDKLCLLKANDGKWLVFYTERGTVSQKVQHPSIREAAQDFFWKLNRQDTPWDYRAEWEAATGQML